MSTNIEQIPYPEDAFDGMENDPWPPFESEEEEEDYWKEFKDVQGDPW